MNSFKLTLLLRLILFGLPYGLLIVVGSLWLYEHGLLIAFVGATALLSLVCWLLLRWIQSWPAPPRAPPLPVDTWPAAGEKAWADVEQLALAAEAHPPSLDDANAIVALFREVFDVVARQFHPKSKQAALEVTVTDALAIAALVIRDLRRFLEEQVPGSGRMTIHNIGRVIQWGPLANQIAMGLYNTYRLARLVANPPAALINEAQTAALGSTTTHIVSDLPRMAAGYCVRRAGRYAIQLYSGQIALDDPEFAELGADKPLRVVVLGQTKAGKSSLINALFGEMRAATDVLPCTDAIIPYVLERDGVFKAIVFDTIGFAGHGDKTATRKLETELERCDLVIAVVSARMAAREADRKLLDEARLRLAERTRLVVPPVVVALSHVDTLRPLDEWNPPYDLAGGESLKVRNMRDAIEAVADDLQVPRDRVVPVCLRAGAVYNVNEGLLPLIARVLPEGDRAKLLRLLMESRTVEQWEALKRQLVNAGLSVVQIGAQWVGKKLGPTPKAT